MEKKKSGLLANLKYDLPASIVVFLVAVPLCLGIALASGAPLFSGIIAGIVGGIVVTSFSGSPLGVSGPAAGLAAIVLTAIPLLGGFEVFLLAVLIAGIFQFVLGTLKAGIIGYYFPSSVIRGMLAGIGVIIFLKQIPHAFGYDDDPEGDFAFKQADGETTFSELVNMMDYITPSAVIISVTSLLIMILWEQKFMKKLSFTQWIQGPLVAVVTGIILTMVFSGIDGFSLEGNHLVALPVAGSIGGFIDLFTLPDFSQWNNPQVYITAITLAVVASLETLLCVEATDKLDPQKRVTPTNRELRAQGIGNMVSGLIGGLPVTQVIVRSSANIQSGGKSKLSALLHGVLILLCVISIPKVLNMIPLASLAAILLVVGYKLAKPALIKEMYNKGWFEFIPFAMTVLGIVFTDLLTGIGLGMMVAVFFILYRNFQIPFFFNTEAYKPGDIIELELSEHVTFLNKAGIQKSLQQLPDGCEVVINGARTQDIHPDVLEIIDDFEENAKGKDITVKRIALDSFMTVQTRDEFEAAIFPEHKSTKKAPLTKS
ncbi:MAG: SulP family inorganic anion transporter [Flavobacteriales bacterium]|nr:SulP family inorganic anion transporter [Flavobacteriales bacterium]NNK80955.1 SulP family inorganic anion transporter [Flavobacteriales bacterium]